MIEKLFHYFGYHDWCYNFFNLDYKHCKYCGKREKRVLLKYNKLDTIDEWINNE